MLLRSLFSSSPVPRPPGSGGSRRSEPLRTGLGRPAEPSWRDVEAAGSTGRGPEHTERGGGRQHARCSREERPAQHSFPSPSPPLSSHLRRYVMTMSLPLALSLSLPPSFCLSFVCPSSQKFKYSFIVSTVATRLHSQITPWATKNRRKQTKKTPISVAGWS